MIFKLNFLVLFFFNVILSSDISGENDFFSQISTRSSLSQNDSLVLFLGQLYNITSISEDHYGEAINNSLLLNGSSFSNSSNFSILFENNDNNESSCCKLI